MLAGTLVEAVTLLPLVEVDAEVLVKTLPGDTVEDVFRGGLEVVVGLLVPTVNGARAGQPIEASSLEFYREYFGISFSVIFLNHFHKTSIKACTYGGFKLSNIRQHALP